MKGLVRILGLIALLVSTSSCSYEELSEKLIPKEESKFAEDYISELRASNIEYIKSQMSEKILKQVNDRLLTQMANHFRKGELISTKIIGSNVHVINGEWNGNFTFEYQFTTGWNIANAALKKVDGKYEVTGLNVYQTEASQKEINAFSLSSKPFLHYLVLLLAIVVPLFVLTTLYFCIKTPMEKRKWAWVIFILLGVGIFQLNWTSGQVIFHLIYVQLFGASAMPAGPHAPWLLSVSLPLGAIVFWVKRKRFLAVDEGAI